MAAASTKRYAEGNPLSVMDGIPVAVKEEFHVVRCDIVNCNFELSLSNDSHSQKLRQIYNCLKFPEPPLCLDEAI